MFVKLIDSAGVKVLEPDTIDAYGTPMRANMTRNGPIWTVC